MKLTEITNTSQFLSNNGEIKAWLDEMRIVNYKIASDGKVSVTGSVNIIKKQLTTIPVQFTEVSGAFNCSDNELTSLAGCPSEVDADFDCCNNKLTSLAGCPTKIGKKGYFACATNKLTSLVGSPSEVDSNFYCNDNELTSLKGCPSKVGGNFYCSTNKLTSLVDCPAEVSGNFISSLNQLTSLVDISDLIKSINGYFDFDFDKIKTGGLSLLLIKNMKKMDAGLNKPFGIINKYIGRPDKIFECQQELIENGFEEYAQL